MTRRRSWWGWGFEDAHLSSDELEALATLVGERFGVQPSGRAVPPDPAALDLPAPRVTAPAALAPLASVEPWDRCWHAHGNAYRDVVRALHAEGLRYPDLVLRPRSADEVAHVLEWCAQERLACVPFGGGTSVVGGVEPPEGDRPIVCLDLGAMDRVLEVDTVSGAAHIQAGALGPTIEDQLRPHGLTLRHFPQSWEFSSLGGWLATRAGGHYATLATRIDDLTEAITAVTPRGLWSSRRLPASGAGPSPDRWLLGSEGAFGVITDAWVRVQPRPVFRASATVTFRAFPDGVAAVRALARSGLYPANCRLLDPAEATLAGAGDGSASVLVLGFESADHHLGPWIDRALELTADHGGSCPEGAHLVEGDRTGTAAGAAGAWRQAFLRAPYLRDALVQLGMVVETFETAVTWDRFDELVAEVRDVAQRSAATILGSAVVTIRVTHAYPDGAAPYLTVIGPGRRGAEVAQWDEIKAAVSDAILAAGGTITHHHGVGRDHVRWYRRQQPTPFAAALRRVKDELDPAGVCNPGVLGLP